jgi:hypothetical protein
MATNKLVPFACKQEKEKDAFLDKEQGLKN